MKISKSYPSPFKVKTLYHAWISPEMLIPPIVKIEVEPRAGGLYILYSDSGTASSIMKGEFIELVVNKRIKYSWQWEGTDELTTILVEFIEKPDGALIQINHEGFLTEESKERHSFGWDNYIKEFHKKLQAAGN